MKAYTVKEVAEITGLSIEKIRRALRAGELKAAKFGSDYRISRHDLNKWYQACGGGSLFNGGDPDPELAPELIERARFLAQVDSMSGDDIPTVPDETDQGGGE